MTLLLISSDVARSSRGQTAAIESGFAHALATSYESNGRWSVSELRPLVALANMYQARIVLRGPAGNVIIDNSAPNVGHNLGPPSTLPIVVNNDTVGTLMMRLASNGVVTSDLRLQRSLVLAVTISGGLAALAAVIASLIVAGRVVRPMNELTAAARSLTGGRWEARVEHRNAPREVSELGEALNSLAMSLEREDALRRALTADIAHELRTPLAVLQVSIEALLDGVLPAEVETFQSLRDEAVHLSQVVEDLERLAEAQAAVLHLERHPFRLDLLVAEVLAELGTGAEAQERNLGSDLAPVVVVADQRRLRQVVTNLLTNAVKFTARGDSIHVQVGPHGADEAEVVVEDSGMGIPPANLPHIFERFWRSPHTAEIAGSGIGLAIVKELVEAHQGTVTAESRPGGGSTFTVLLSRETTMSRPREEAS